MATTKRRREYTTAERDAVLAEVEALGVTEAARKHGVPQPTVSGWLRRAATSRSGAASSSGAAASIPKPPPAPPEQSTDANPARVAKVYTPSQKAVILEAAATDGVTAASTKHGVSRFSIYEWRRQVKKAAAGEAPSPTSGPAPMDVEEKRDAEILDEWKRHPGLGPSQIVNQLRRRNVRVSTHTARRVMEDAGYRPPKVERKKHDRRYEAVRPNHL